MVLVHTPVRLCTTACLCAAVAAAVQMASEESHLKAQRSSSNSSGAGVRYQQVDLPAGPSAVSTSAGDDVHVQTRAPPSSSSSNAAFADRLCPCAASDGCLSRHWRLIAAVGLIILTIAVVVGVTVRHSPPPLPSDPLARALALQRLYPLIDGHNDLPWALREWNNGTVLGPNAPDLSTRQPQFDTDFERAVSGVMGGQFWSVYVGCESQDRDAVRQTLEQIDVVKKLLRRYPQYLRAAYTADDVYAAHAAGKIGSLIGVEGGHQIDQSLGALRMFYDAGARYMTLTHTCNTRWSLSCADVYVPSINGLNAFGRGIVREMNRIGMLVDLSHVSAVTMHAALNASVAPVIFSHSGAYAVCAVPRNVPDDVLRRLPANGGVVNVNFFSQFVACADTSTVAQVADHIDHIVNVTGSTAHVGYGSDFDGASHMFPAELRDVSMFPNLTAELIRRGYSDEQVAGMFGGNLLRALRQAQAIAEQLQAAGTLADEDVAWFPVNGSCRSFE